MNLKKFRCFLCFTTLLLGVLLLGGCAADDIQFEGKIFEAVGLDGQFAKREDPKVRERAPIVMPPEAKLPEPGKRARVTEETQWPDDPDERAKRVVSARELERQKYCKDVGHNQFDPDYDKEKSSKCNSLLNNSFKKAFGRTDEIKVE